MTNIQTVEQSVGKKMSNILNRREEKKIICLLKDLTKRNLSPGVTIGMYIDCKKKYK